MSYSFSFPSGDVHYFPEKDFNQLHEIANNRKLVLVTDQHVHALYPHLFAPFNTIVIPAGEEHKNLESLNYITQQLIRFEADRKTLVVGVGGGMITDLTGFAASVYMRGVKFGFVPTTLLAMVDAAVGGKNGVNAGLYKNMLGTVRQPEFILFDTSFLQTLPDEEWSNGFAEVIKYGCIFDIFLFDELLSNNILFFKSNFSETRNQIERCVGWKNKIVQEDETEQGIRKHLNFGHTVGHAIEKVRKIKHGFAIGIGMIVACMISEKVSGLDKNITNVLKRLLVHYDLPTHLPFDPEEVMSVLRMDKKRNADRIDFIVLEKIGKARIEIISFDIIHQTLLEYLHASDY